MGCRQFRQKTVYKTALDVYEMGIIFHEDRRTRGKAITSPQGNKEMTFHINILLENVRFIVQKYSSSIATAIDISFSSSAGQFSLINELFFTLSLFLFLCTLQSGIDIPPDYLFFPKMHTRTFLLQPPHLLILSQEEIFPTRPRIVQRK